MPAGTTSGRTTVTVDPVSTKAVHGTPSTHMGMWQKSAIDVLPTTITFCGEERDCDEGVRSVPSTAPPCRFPVLWPGQDNSSPGAPADRTPSKGAAESAGVTAAVPAGAG